MRTYVYLHVDPIDKSEKYIGITINLKLRIYQHMHDTYNNPGKVAWLQGLRAQGLEPEVIILDECTTFEQAREREKYWIRYYIEHGAHLLNVSDNPLVAPVTSCTTGYISYRCPKLRSLRKEKGYTQRSLADAIGVQEQTIRSYENMKSGPHPDTQRKLSEVLGVPVEELFEDAEELANAS